MDKISFNNLNNMQLDVLRELGNIGAGNATTALSSMLNKKVDMAVPKINLLDLQDVAQLLGGEETVIAAVLTHVSGDVNGIMMFASNLDDARELVHLLTGMELSEGLNELGLSALEEIGNIITGAYLNSLATLISKKMVSSVPNVAIDMAAAILSVPAIEFGKIGDKVLFIQTDFGEDINNIEGYFIFVPDIDSINILLNTLGVG